MSTLDLGEIARRRATLRENMPQWMRPTADLALDCPCIVPWAGESERRDLDLVQTISLDICAVKTCVACGGTGRRRGMATALANMRQIVHDETTPCPWPTLPAPRHNDPRFPRPKHTAQPGETWERERRELGQYLFLHSLWFEGEGGRLACDADWRASIDRIAAERRRTR